MMPPKNIMLRFSFIILVMVLIGIAIICKAGVIMFAERQYWKDVADRFVKENVTVRPTRGNIISLRTGQLSGKHALTRIISIYMDFMNKVKGVSELFTCPNPQINNFSITIFQDKILSW